MKKALLHSVDNMKLILHVGMSKTGTTALQTFMSNNRSQLAKHGILYPSVNSSPENHNFLSLFLRQNDFTPRKFLSIYHGNKELMMSDAELNWQQIKTQINKYKPSIMILSGEQIFRGFQVGDVSAFRSRLKELASDIQVVLYVRKPSAHYLSLAQQSLKASSRVPLLGNLSFRKVIETIEENFKIKPIVIEYNRSKLYKEDIRSDFIQRSLPDMQLELDYSYSGDINESLSAESMAILQDFRAVNYPQLDNIFTPDSQVLVNVLQNLEKKYKLNKRPVLIKEVADFIDYSCLDLRFLEENYGIRFSGIDYDCIAKTEFKSNSSMKVADICIVDEENKSKILMLALKELTKPKRILPNSLHIWIQRRVGSFYIQWLLRLKVSINKAIHRIFMH